MPRLAQDFLKGIEKGLCDARLFDKQVSKIEWFAAPRRLAVYVSNLPLLQPEQEIERFGPNIKAAYDAEGNASKALQGFARSCGVELEKLSTKIVGKDEKIYYQATQSGGNTIDLLADIVTAAIKTIQIAKPMRWGDNASEFIRPVHWVLMLFGNDIVPTTVLGKETGRSTYGHRFHAPEAIHLQHPGEYKDSLAKSYVMVDFADRKKHIEAGVVKAAEAVNGQAIYPAALLDEVTAIVEHPEVLTANFAPAFLQVPQEALISAMQSHQKSFPVFDVQGKLLPHFIFVANINSKNPKRVIAGNEKVMHARLSDAAFFYETDLKHKLCDHLPELKSVIFQKQLGTLYERSLRLSKLSGLIAKQLNADIAQAERAGLLAKCDLLSNMVNEFPKLQGIMGGYYAKHDGETESVCAAMAQHYLPTYAGDALPSNDVATCVALADKLDVLVGIFSIGQKPTGDKDPFGLRRAAIGVVRILLEKQLDINVADLINNEVAVYGDIVKPETGKQVFAYILERLKHYYFDKNVAAKLFSAVSEVTPVSLVNFDKRLQAVAEFSKLPQAENLAQANKRVKNILTKQNALDVQGEINTTLLTEVAEIALAELIKKKQAHIKPLVAEKNYQAVLENLDELEQPVDQFFTDVMVMTEDAAVKHNRLLLLNQLRQLFLTVADVSQLD